MSSEVVSLLQWIGNAVRTLRNVDAYQKNKSLADVGKLTRVEPLTVVSKDCITLDYLPEIMNTTLNVFSAYYLQAVSIYGQIDSVRIMKILDRLNPDRDRMPDYLIDAAEEQAAKNGTNTWGFESINDMPTLVADNYKYKLPKTTRVATEGTLLTKPDQQNPINVSASVDGDANKVLSEMSNLAVGKVLDVRIKVSKAGDNIPSTKEISGSDVVSIPVTVRLTPALLTNHSILNILTLKSQDNSLVERFHAWRAGRISFIQDMIFCQDLIDAHKKALMEDQEGVYSEIIRRTNNAKVGGLISKNPSLVSASNLFIISEDVAKQVEQKLGGKLSNANIRNLAFDNTYAMLLIVVDREWERVTIYTRGVSVGSSFSVKEIKSISKGKGPDVMDILKAMNMGGQISF